eukprot:scaffold223547_cov18-Tisochrysis_lutea.AAC.1
MELRSRAIRSMLFNPAWPQTGHPLHPLCVSGPAPAGNRGGPHRRFISRCSSSLPASGRPGWTQQLISRRPCWQRRLAQHTEEEQERPHPLDLPGCDMEEESIMGCLRQFHGGEDKRSWPELLLDICKRKPLQIAEYHGWLLH